jgi:hypothetical protein
MTEFSVRPEGGTWEEADRPTLSDAIDDAERAVARLWIVGTTESTAARLARATETLIARAMEADDKLKEYR